MPEVVFRVAREFDVVTVRISEDVQAVVNRLVSEGRCLACKKKLATDEKRSRGQCVACFSATHRAIAKRKTTVNELLRSGELLPKGKPGPKPANDYTRKLAEL